MFPKLSDLFHYLFGITLPFSFQTYGFFLAMAFIFGAFILRSELKRMEREGKLLPKIIQIKKDKEAIIHPYQYTWGIFMVALIAALVGSKLFDIIDNFSQFLKTPLVVFLSSQGFSFYGGMIITVLSLLVYVKMLGLDRRYVIDCTAPAISIGYALGRLGCHLSGDGCWGVVNVHPKPTFLGWLPDSFWAFSYPHNVSNQGIGIPGCMGHHCMELAQPVYPTALYEAILAMVTFFFLWSVRRKIQKPVVLFGLFLVLFSTARLLVEQIRVHNTFQLFTWNMSQAEFISVVLILIGFITIYLFSKGNSPSKS